MLLLRPLKLESRDWKPGPYSFSKNSHAEHEM
jgi:hypothetical protein